MLLSARRARRPIDAWPGYVDVLAALLILVIFVLLLFSFAQFLLSQVLDEQETELDVMYQRVVELTDLLGLEQERSAQLTRDVDALGIQVTQLGEQRRTLADRVGQLSAENASKDAQLYQRLMLAASLQEDIDTLRKLRTQLEAEVGHLASELGRRESALGEERNRSQALQASLANQTERTLLAQRALAEQEIRIQALSALVAQRDQALEREQALTANAQAEVALLNDKLDHLREQLADINQALAAAEADKTRQASTIDELGRRLNVALAREVNRLERYRSDFFGRLREVLGSNPSIRVVGDRFVLPSELLFDSGSAVLADTGKTELDKLAVTLRGLAARIPSDVDWILRVDGHTDRVPISTARFASNWELSTARAVSVVRFLIERGIAAPRLSAAGFGEHHPIDPADTPAAYQRNRRIELKLTAR
jgi:chemotaxis protein MotB